MSSTNGQIPVSNLYSTVVLGDVTFSLATQNTGVNLHPEVRKEWVEKRGLAPEWVEANITYVTAAEAKKKLGNFTIASDGHWIEGDHGYGQFRPLVPHKSKDGQQLKYVSPSSSKAEVDAIAPIYPHKPDFWDSSEAVQDAAFKKDGKPCVIIAEGVAKAISLCSNIAPSIAITGCWNGTREIEVEKKVKVKGEWVTKTTTEIALVDTLAHTQSDLNLGIIIALDQDEKWSTREQVEKAILRLAETIGEHRPIWIANWDSKLGKGADDVIQVHGTAPILHALNNAIPFKDWKRLNFPETKKAKFRKLLDGKYSGRIRFNLLKHEITLDGRVVTPPSEVRLDVDTTTWFDFQATVESELGLDLGDNTFFNGVLDAARKHSFHPVRDYLNHVKAIHLNTPDGAINELCDILGLKTSIERIQLERHLIASVKRITQPGCKYDTVPVFFGEQGLNKTTLWETLYGESFFSTLRVSDSDKDTIMNTHKFWAVEYGEIDVIYKKKEVEQVKANLSTRSDTYRPPYERMDRTVPRSFVFVGSTNKPEFLLDDENRRFWMLEPTADPVIDLDRLRNIRDAIWAEAYKKAEAGAEFWFTRGTHLWNEQAALAKRYELASHFYETIEHIVKRLPEAFSMESLCNAMNVSLTDRPRLVQYFAKDLKLMGYTNKGLVGDKRVKLWRKNEPSQPKTLTSYTPEGGTLNQPSAPLSNETLTQSQSERGEIPFFNNLRGIDLDDKSALNNVEGLAKSEKTHSPLTNPHPERIPEVEESKAPLTEAETLTNHGVEPKSNPVEAESTPVSPLKVGDLVKHNDPYQAYWVRLGKVVEVQGSDVKVDWHHTDHKPELHEMSELERLQLSGNKHINEKVYPKLQSATNHYWYDTDVCELRRV